VGLGWYPSDAHCTAVTVKDGTTDVTAAVKSGTYRTPALGVHGTRALKATVKRTGASGCGPYDYIRLTTSLQRSVWLLVPFPAE
jgi:hypothetical protein